MTEEQRRQRAKEQVGSLQLFADKPKERNRIIREIQRLHKGRKPLNIAAVKRHSPELIDAVYRQSPFWGWKGALEDAGLSCAPS